MEPTQESVTQYRIPARVESVERRSFCTGGKKNERGEKELFYGPMKWYVHLEGSAESLCFGDERPDLESGDFVDVIIRRRK